ncbi:RidA family protein [Pseudonocardia acaciae]|uniref:RidA family protein n=1 Tax=Pseudonocardia acaciae TaxID=551276 RepID=UPI000A005FF8|nr:RidA family protein [Pseudonocardia acaciae]
MTDTRSQEISTPALSAEVARRFAYSYGVRTGDTVRVSGMVALDHTGGIVGENDVRAQAAQVFENLRAVLQAAGGGLDDLVETTTYLTDMADVLAVNEVRARYLTGPVKPTSTLVGVAALARPQFLVEISAVAVLPADAR